MLFNHSMSLITKIFVLFSVAILINGCNFFNSREDDDKRITVAAAGNLAPVMNELIAAFKEESGMECHLVFGSSGMLTAQIFKGAPYDIFLSADTNYTQKIYDEGFSNEKPKAYAYGELVMWTSNLSIVSLEQLNSDDVDKIAIANIKNAPYGKLAYEILIKNNIWNSISHKVVQGDNISQINSYISSGSVNVGFTTKSAFFSNEKIKDGKWIELKKYHPILPQNMILLNESARKFFQFMIGKKAQNILKKNGYKSIAE